MNPRRWLAGLALLCSGCASTHYTLNAPLSAPPGEGAYTAAALASDGNSDSLLLVLAFSGGGYRAAALSFALLELMRDTPIQWEGRERPLLDEVDFVSSVSGGSLTAAYYALHREAFFDRFEREVLSRDLQSSLWRRLLSPAALWRQTSQRYGRGDLLQEELDEQVFKGARFADLPRRRPLVIINAADLHFGDRFEFTQDQFDYLCSDLDPLPLSRAVAASMAVPIVFSPITLWNHRAACPVALNRKGLVSRAHTSPYVHLVDGGLSDNTGVRAPLEIIGARGGMAAAVRSAGMRGVQKQVYIVVNAQTALGREDHRSPDTPGLWRQLRGVIDVPIDRYAETSIGLLKDAVDRWEKELQQPGRHDPEGAMAPSAQFHVIELSMTALADDPSAGALRELGTGLRITPSQLDAIRQFVRRELGRNPAWQALMNDLRPPAAAAPAVQRLGRGNTAASEDARSLRSGFQP